MNILHLHPAPRTDSFLSLILLHVNVFLCGSFCAGGSPFAPAFLWVTSTSLSLTAPASPATPSLTAVTQVEVCTLLRLLSSLRLSQLRRCLRHRRPNSSKQAAAAPEETLVATAIAAAAAAVVAAAEKWCEKARRLGFVSATGGL
jgi:hypothetical protein